LTVQIAVFRVQEKAYVCGAAPEKI